MNRIFKKIWNKSRGCFVAVSEAATAASQSAGKATVVSTVAISLAIPCIASALTISNLQLNSVEDTPNNYDVKHISLSAQIQLIPGAAESIHLGSKNDSVLSLGGTTTTNSTVQTTGFQRFYNHYVLGQGNGFSYLDSDMDYWHATDDQLTATSYAGSIVEPTYNTSGVRTYPLDRRINTENNNNSQSSYQLLSYYNDPVIFNKLVELNALQSSGTTNFIINAGDTITSGRIDVSETEKIHNINYGILIKHAYWWQITGSWCIPLLSLIVENNVVASSGQQATNIVNNGGILNTNKLNLCPNCTYTQNSGSSNIGDITGGGTVIINGGEVVTNGLLNINAAQAANVLAKDLNTLANLNAISYAAGTKASLGGFTPMSDKIQFGNATLKISGDYTQAIRDQATIAIKNKFGSGINVQFTGNITPDNLLDLSKGWTSSVLNSIFEENNRSNYLFYTLNWNAENQNKVVGSGDIQKNFGVKNVDNAGSITVNNGTTFAILGESANTNLAGKMFTADNGTLVFGAAGLPSGGQAGQVIVLNNGKVRVASGDFTIDNLSLSGSAINTGNLRLKDFSFGSNALLTSSGTLSADQDKLFAIEDSAVDGLNVIGINSQSAQEVQQQFTELFRKYVPGNQKVLQEIVDHMQFSGGKLIVTAAHLTQTQRDDLIAAFKSKFGNTTDLEFQGTVSGVSIGDQLTVEKVNELYDNVAELRDVLYIDRKLEGQNGAVIVGNSGLKNNTGFTGLNETTATGVQDGKELTLIGAVADGTGNRFNVAENTISVVGDGSKLILGHLGIANSSAYQGQANEVNLASGGALKIAAGDYKVLSHSSDGGLTTVENGAIFSADSVNVTNHAEFINKGKSTVGALSGHSGAIVTNNQNATLTVNGETNLGGRLINNGKATLQGTANIDGTLQNQVGAKIYANTINVNGTLRNYGYIEALDNSTVFGTLENPGEIRLFNTGIGNRGDINNTYTLIATGKTQIAGLLSNAAGATATFSGADSELTIVDGGMISNMGTLIADIQTVSEGGYALNGDPAQVTGMLFSSSASSLQATPMLFASSASLPTEQLAQLEVAEGGNKTNTGLGYYGKGTIAGTFVNTASAQAFGGVSTVFASGEGLTVTSTGEIHNEGVFTFGGSLSNAGTIDGDGTIVFSRANNGVDTFTNTGTIAAGELEAENITYSQTAGTMSAANGWFSNSVVNLTGGKMEHDNLGSGNTYNLGSGSGANDIATLTVGVLDSSSEVFINQGATLRTENIALTGNKTTHLVGGRLSTTLDQVFNDLDYSALNLDATDPNDRVEVTSTPQIVTGAGEVIQSVADGIEFAWGTVAFDDASYSAGLAADVTAKLVAIGDVPASHHGELEVAFNGRAAENFNVDLANTVSAVLPDGSAAFATFANETLTNESAANPGATALVVGINDHSAQIVPTSGTPNVLEHSMGFMNIEGASGGVYVNDGSHLVLVGKAEPNPNIAPIELADGTVWVGGQGAAGDSKLTLGSFGSASATKGQLAALNVGVGPNTPTMGGLGGKVFVKNGEFSVDVLNNGSAGTGGDNKGIVIGSTVDRTATLTVGTYNSLDLGSLLNEGIFNADSVTSKNNANDLINRHLMTVGTADWTGVLINDGEAHFNQLTLRDSGNVNGKTNAQAQMTVGSLTVAGDGMSGDSGTLPIRGKLTNKAMLTVSGTATVEGDLENNAGELQVERLAVNAASGSEAGSFVNNATAKIDSVVSQVGTSIRNAQNAVMDLLGLNQSSDLAGTLENNGTLNVQGTQTVSLTAGELTNNGSLNSTNENLTVAGGTLNNIGNAVLNGITVTAGKIVNAVNAVFKDTGTTKIQTADAGDTAVQNSATLELTNLELLKGIIEGGTVGVKDTTVATISADGSVSAENVAMQKLTNEGTVTVTHQFDVADTQNSGEVVIDASGVLASSSTDTFTNEAAGTLNSSGTVELNGKLINQGTTNIALLNIGSSGVLSAQAATDLNKVNAVSGAVINAENGVITIAELNAQEATYNQTAGTLSAVKGWFDNSTLNIMGGVLDASQVKDSSGNVTGLLGKNVVNISGPNATPLINNEDTAADKSHYKDTLTQVIAGTVNSDTTVNIMSGGVLDVQTLDLDGRADTINLQGGVLQTSADQIFESVTTEAIRLDAEDAQSGTVQLPTSVLTATTVGAVKDEVKSGLNVQSGNLALDDDWFSASLIVSVTDKIAQAFTNAASLTINFLGEMAAPFTVTTAQELEAEGLDVVLSPGIVLNTTTLHNESAAEYNKDTDASQTVKGLVIGAAASDPATANSINISMGFRNITHADNVTIEGGRELALVGNAVNAIPEASYADDDNKLLTNASDGGSVNVNDGKFTFGTHGGVTPTVGWINSSVIGANGAIEAKNGEFADWTIVNNGQLNVYSNAVLHTNNYSGSGMAVNAGKFSLDAKDGTDPTFEISGSFTNQGANSVLDAAQVAMTEVGGSLVNEGQAQYHDMTVAATGSSKNSGSEQGNLLTVAGTHENTGTSVWNGVEVCAGGKAENSANLNVGASFAVNGEFVNKGTQAVLDATGVPVTTVQGQIINEGKADYDDMTVENGGKSENFGTEKGDILTVAAGAEHVNSGISIWNNVNVQTGATSTTEAGGKDTISGQYVVEGTKINQGELDATAVAETEVAGSLNNQGHAEYDDMTVKAGGKSDNSGYEKGDILTIADGGEHVNSGTSVWNNLAVLEGGSSTTEEGAKETINDTYVVAGDKTNKGEIDATGVENTEVTGTLDNQGHAEYDDMTVGNGGKSDNSGYEKGDILTIAGGGEHDNSGTSIWNNVVVAGGDINNSGDIDTDKLTINDGTVKIGAGSLKADETALNGGELVIGNDLDPIAENRVVAEINPNNDVIDTNIYVKNNGDLNLGPDGGLDWADSLGAPSVPSGTPSRLVVTTNVTTGPGGGIAVGPEVWTDSTQHVQIGNGDLYFAKDSVTVIPAGILTDGKSAFNTISDVAKVTVEPGANLVLGNIEEVGDYTIVNGFITAGNESDGRWIGGWTAENLYALPQDGSGINWVLTLHNDPSKIWVNAVLADVRTVYPNIAIPNIANDSMLNCKSGDAGADFVCRILRDKELDVAAKTKVLNSVANIAFAGGVAAVSMNDLNSAADSVEGRVSMKAEAFNEDGRMRDWERGNNLWVDVLGGKQKYKSLSATGIGKAGFDTNSYGLVMGYDRKIADQPWIIGAAFSYNHGSLDSTGDVLKTKNKYDSFGLHAYSAYSPSDKLNIIGTLSYMHNSSDVTQSIQAAGFNKAEADVKTNLFSAALRAESTIKAGRANLVPHAGVRYVWSKSGDYDTKVDGKKVWSNSASATNTFQIPIGVAVRADIPTANGWNVRPQADITIVPQAGDTKQKTTLKNFNGATDQLSGEFAGKFGANVTLGVQADKGAATVGFRYGFAGGNKGKADHALKLEARYRF